MNGLVITFLHARWFTAYDMELDMTWENEAKTNPSAMESFARALNLPAEYAYAHLDEDELSDGDLDDEQTDEERLAKLRRWIWQEVTDPSLVARGLAPAMRPADAQRASYSAYGQGKLLGPTPPMAYAAHGSAAQRQRGGAGIFNANPSGGFGNCHVANRPLGSNASMGMAGGPLVLTGLDDDAGNASGGFGQQQQHQSQSNVLGPRR